MPGLTRRCHRVPGGRQPSRRPTFLVRSKQYIRTFENAGRYLFRSGVRKERASPVMKRRRFLSVLAILGLLITFAFWAYNVFSDHYSMLTATFMILCPPSILSIPFWETGPETVPGIVIWSVIGLLNSVLYVVIGLVIRWWSGRKTGVTDHPPSL